MTTADGRDFSELVSDPAFAVAYARERAKIDTVDHIVRVLDEARVARGLTKAQVADAADLPRQSVRRFFTNAGNPTLWTVVAMASVLGVSLRADAPPSPAVATRVRTRGEDAPSSSESKMGARSRGPLG